MSQHFKSPKVEKIPQSKQPNGNPWVKLQGYDLISELGKGQFGQVMKARCRKTNNFVAIKHIKLNSEHYVNARLALGEIQSLKQLSKIPGNAYTT